VRLAVPGASFRLRPCGLADATAETREIDAAVDVVDLVLEAAREVALAGDGDRRAVCVVLDQAT